MNRQKLIDKANEQEKIMKSNFGMSDQEMTKFNEAKIKFFQVINALSITWEEWDNLSTNK